MPMQGSSSKGSTPTIYGAHKQPACTLALAASPDTDSPDFKIAAVAAPSMASLVAPAAALFPSPDQPMTGISVTTSSDSSFKFYDSPVFEAAQHLPDPPSSGGSISSYQPSSGSGSEQHQLGPGSPGNASGAELVGQEGHVGHKGERQHRIRDAAKPG